MEACGGARGARHLSANSQLPKSARQAIDRHIHFAVVDRASAHIRLSLRINISLIIEEIYKMVEDFSTQFNPLYLSMKYLAIIQTLCIYEYVYIYIHIYIYIWIVQKVIAFFSFDFQMCLFNIRNEH